MKKLYMNYGSIQNLNQYTPATSLKLVDYNKKGQVYQLTHGGEGESLSFMNKAFISFTYGGKKIEDFGFIATTINNRLDRENSPNSEDYTTEYKMLHGQYYWGSHYHARELTISLATDGITQKELDDFKYWFQPGEIKELILSEHPNRAILARIQDRPEISVLPFKRTERILVNHDWQLVEVIDYKGEAQITFVMDEPFWYAKENVLGQLVRDKLGHNVLVDKWINSNNLVLDVLDEDGIKVVKEDKIPSASMINQSVNFSNTKYIPYNQYKYTLTNETIGEAINEETGKLEAGTPLANDPQDIQYPISGAVVGHIYQKVYEDGEVVTTLPNDILQLGYTFGQGDTIIESKYAINYNNNYFYLTRNYIFIKKGSTIRYTAENMIDISVQIREYSENKHKYTRRENGDYILSSNNPIYLAKTDTYIRIAFTLPKKTPQFTNSELFWNKIISINIYPLQNTDSHLNLDKDSTPLYYFYSGNADSYPVVNFLIPIHFNEDGYIDSFSSEFSSQNDSNYNSLILESAAQHELKITSPSIFSSYNQVIKKLKENTINDLPSFIQELRSEIGHPGVRNWIINCINVYYNNFNISSLTIGPEVKNVLLQYMPYFFASIDEAGITPRDDEPSVIQQSSKSIVTTKILRTDNLANRFAIKNKEIEVTEGGSFKISISAFSDVAGKKELVEGLNYQWRYTTDSESNKWYLLYDDKDEEDNYIKWEGTTSKSLILHNALQTDFNLQIQCVVSNNTSYQLSDIITIKRFYDDLYVNASAETVVADQNSNASLVWQVSGSFLTGNEEDCEQYAPTIYYQVPDSEDWILYDQINNNYDDQISTGLLIPTLTENTDMYGNLITLYEFNFKVKEDEGKESQQNYEYNLRGTKFKLVVYKRTADSIITPSSNVFLDFPDIQLNINRLLLRNAIVTVSAKGPQFTTYLPVSSYPFGCLKGTIIRVDVTNINNYVNISNSNFLQYSIDNGNKWSKLEPTKNLKTSIIKNNGVEVGIRFSWTVLNIATINSKTAILSFGFTNYNETLYLYPMDNSTPQRALCVYQLANQDLTLPLDTYQSVSANYIIVSPDNSTVSNGQYKVNLYSGEKLSVKVTHTNSFPITVSQYRIIANWQKKVNNTDNWEIINNTLFDSGTKPVSDRKDYWDKEFLFNIPTANISNDKGYYKCLIKIYFLNPAYEEGNGQQQWYDFNISPAGLIVLDVIDKMQIQDPISNCNNWTYYSLERNMDDDQGNNYFIDNTQSFTFEIKSKISNYNENNILSSGTYFKLYYKSAANGAWISVTDGEISISEEANEYYIEYQKIYTGHAGADALYLTNGYHYYFEIIDKYKSIIASNEITININKENSRQKILNLKDIATIKINEDENIVDYSYVWNWPVITWTQKQTQINGKTYHVSKWGIDQNRVKPVLYKILLDVNKQQLQLSGTPVTNTNDNTPTLAAYTDGYDSNFYTKNGVQIFQPSVWEPAMKNYTGYNALYIPIFLFDPKKYKYLKFTATSDISTSSQFKYYYRVKQGENIIKKIEKLISNSIEIELEEEDIDNINENFIQFLLLIYKDNKDKEKPWSSNIGAFDYDHASIGDVVFDGDVKLIILYSQVMDHLFNSNNFPRETITLSNITIIAKERTNINSNSMLNTNSITPRSRMLKSPMLAAPMVAANVNYEPPVIQKSYPIQLNCKTGEYTMLVSYNTIDWPNGNLLDLTNNISKNNPQSICYLSSLRHGQSYTTMESIGNAILSDELVFSLQNHFDLETYTVQPWQLNDKTLSYKVTYNGDIPLLNFNMTYKNLYL